MKIYLFIFFLFFPLTWALFPGAIPDEGDYRHLYPTLCLAIRSFEGFDQYSLPYAIGLIEEIQYPKDRMHVNFFITELEEVHLIHRSLELLKKWISVFSQFYLTASFQYIVKNWREEALTFGRRKSCSYVFITTSDNFLMKNSLNQLIGLKALVVSPLLNAPFGNYSNVYNLLGDDFVMRKKIGSTRVYYANEPLLIDLKHKDGGYLTFEAENIRNYVGNGHPTDVFAFSAYSMNVFILIDNTNFYGYILDSRMYSSTQYGNKIAYFMANFVSDSGPMPFPHSTILIPTYPQPIKFGFDEIFLINLERRPERLTKMSSILRLLGVEFKRFNAVDGQKLSEEELSKINFLPGYEDPYHRRPMKQGEIGCFLSHYKIWQEIVDKKLDRVIILEDDLRFTEDGMDRVNKVMEDIIKTRLDWEFIYLGRKKISEPGDEYFVRGHRYLSTIGYSYWTLGYALTFNGAKKLLNANPLQKLMALDEFLPIMYNKHPNKAWKEQFMEEERTLKAFAIYPVVVEPERYTHQPGYISDTEASSLVENLLTQNNSKDFKNEKTLKMNEEHINKVNSLDSKSHKDL